MWSFGLLYFVLTAVVVSGQLHQCQDDYDPCNSINLDRCGYQIYGLIHRPATTPTSRKDLKQVCQNMNLGVECLKDRLRECPTIMSSKLAPGYLESLPKIIADICDDGGKELGKKLIPHGHCIRRRLEGFNCPPTFFDEVESAVLEDTADEQLFATCCASAKYDRCSFIATKNACGLAAANAKNALTLTLSGFLYKTCEPILKNQSHRCAHKIPIELPPGHRVVTNVLVGLNDIFLNLLGP